MHPPLRRLPHADANRCSPSTYAATPNGWRWPVRDRRVRRSLTSPRELHFGLLGDFQRVVDLDPKIPNSALELGMAKQELNSSEISGPPVDQRRFRTTQGMRAVRCRIKSNRSYPRSDDPGALPSREMSRLRNAARKQKLLRFQMCRGDPRGHRAESLDRGRPDPDSGRRRISSDEHETEAARSVGKAAVPRRGAKRCPRGVRVGRNVRSLRALHVTSSPTVRSAGM